MRVRIAATTWTRLRGLLFRERQWLGEDGALLLVPCDRVHTIGMAYPIDVAFLDSEGRVLLSREGLAPGRLLGCKGAVAVLERPSAGSDFRPPGSWLLDGEAVIVGKAA